MSFTAETSLSLVIIVTVALIASVAVNLIMFLG